MSSKHSHTWGLEVTLLRRHAAAGRGGAEHRGQGKGKWQGRGGSAGKGPLGHVQPGGLHVYNTLPSTAGELMRPLDSLAPPQIPAPKPEPIDLPPMPRPEKPKMHADPKTGILVS